MSKEGEQKKIGDPSPEAIDFAKRMIALKWTKETNVDIVAGNWMAGYIHGKIDEGKEWISVQDFPLFTIDDKGHWECTDNGGKEFIAAVPYVDETKPGKELWWMKHCVFEDEIGLCVVGDVENEPAGWDMEDVTHYWLLPSPPVK